MRGDETPGKRSLLTWYHCFHVSIGCIKTEFYHDQSYESSITQLERDLGGNGALLLDTLEVTFSLVV